VQYNGKDISGALAPYVIELVYTDKTGGAADSFEITLEDSDQRWMNQWYPNFGDTITAQLGYAGSQLLSCGTFEVDEVDIEGPPDTARIKALGAGVKRAVRTRRGAAYENTTLEAIARTVARRNKLTLKGKIERIQIVRVSQSFETDLAFLQRVAAEYGYEFSVRAGAMTFFKRADLKASEPVLTIDRKDITSYHLHDKVHQIYVAATYSAHNPRKKRTHKKRVLDPSLHLSKYDHYSEDELNVSGHAEDDTQANTKSQAALERANDDQTQMTLHLPGVTKLAAGVTIMVTGFGKLNGKYSITQSTHRIGRDSGYTSEVELKRVREAANGAPTNASGTATSGAAT